MTDDTPSPSYNGPDKSAFNDALAELIELRFVIMRHTSKVAKLKGRWEFRGGEFEDVQHGLKMTKLTADDQRAKISARSRVEGWLGIATVTEDSGQISFTASFDAPPDELGWGGAPLGSRLSLARARADAYNTAKAGGSLADCPVPAESEEAHAWAEGYGAGMEDRKPPRPKKEKPGGTSATEEMAETAGAMPQSESEQAVVAEAKKRRGRPPKLPPPGSDDDLPAAIH